MQLVEDIFVNSHVSTYHLACMSGYERYGGGAAGLKHVDVPIPTPNKDEVLVKLEATRINPLDCKVQKGMIRPFLPRKFPRIPSKSISPLVLCNGIFRLLHSLLSGGGLAEFAVAKESLTVARPTEVSAAEGAGLPIAAPTAHQALAQSAGIKLDRTGKQSNILITAASGGVGHYAVQLAKLGNTHVTATCGTRNIEFVKSLGADEVLDYKTQDGAALNSPSGRKYDAVIHCMSGIPWSTFEPNLSANGKLVKERKLKTVIDSKHPLNKAEDAWAKSIDGHATGLKETVSGGNSHFEQRVTFVACNWWRIFSSIHMCLHLPPSMDEWLRQMPPLHHTNQFNSKTVKRRRFYSIGSVAMAENVKMHAVQYERYGGGAAGLKHVDLPIPTPNKDEVLVKLEATSLNPFDWKVQKGMLRLLLPRKFPHIPAVDVAGEVVRLGSDVKNFKTGDKVVAMLNPTSGGGLAEFAVARESLTVARPTQVSAAEGAGLPVAALTAHQALAQSAGIKLDRTGNQANILITAASGGVGHYAVQLAKLGNTHVTATCGARNIEFVKSLGADEVLDYKTQDGAALNSPSGRKYDAVIHCASSIPWSTFEPNLSANGKVIDITPSPSAFLTFALKKLTFSKKQLVPLILIPKSEHLNYLVQLVKERKLKTVIDSKHPLNKAEDAWAKSIDGHATGKIIVEP
ncbi:hypothetical protein Q3G72_000623 [Acer saccharum]|nr:hypothetical protein Q3G72_000623 [Acer saccharum]